MRVLLQCQEDMSYVHFVVKQLHLHLVPTLPISRKVNANYRWHETESLILPNGSLAAAVASASEVGIAFAAVGGGDEKSPLASKSIPSSASENCTTPRCFPMGASYSLYCTSTAN